MIRNLMSPEELLAATLNRERVANKQYTEAYAEVEEALQTIPLAEPLPSWIPQGNLPTIPKYHTIPHHLQHPHDDPLEQLIDNT